MKTRHIIAIGILTATAIGILALGIKLNHKPKTCETNAYYSFEDYTYNATNPTYTIEGTCNNTNTNNATGGTQNLLTFDYTITKTTNQLWFTINTDQIVSREEFTIDYNVEQTGTITTGNKQIARVDFYQSFNIADDRDYPIIDWVIILQPKIYFTDSTETSTNIWIYVDQINQNTYWLEETNEWKCDEIQINPTLETLKETYATGYNTAESVASPIDIRGLMLNVLTMPFTFITQAFNVTMWEGTPYQINIANFIKSLIAIATILFIIKLFTSGFNVIGNYTSSRLNNKLTREQIKQTKSKTALNNRTNPNHKTRSTTNTSHVTIRKE